MRENNTSIYLNQEAVTQARKSGIRRASIGGILFAFFGSTYIRLFMEVGTAAFSNAHEIAGSIMALMVEIIILTPLFLLFRSGFRRVEYAGRAVRYAELFDGEASGCLLFSEIANKLHIPAERIGKDMKELLRRKYIQRAQVVDGDPGCILLTNSRESRWNRACYLNERQVNEDSTVSIVFIVVSTMFVISFLVTLPMMITMSAQFGDSSGLTFLIGSLVIYGALALVGLRALRNRSSLKRTGIYNQYLEESPEPEVPLKKLAAGTGTSPEQVIKDLRWLFSKQIIRNCRLDLRQEPSLLLSDILDGRADFSAQKCPGCGQTSRIRTGRVAKCRYCGRLLTAPYSGSIQQHRTYASYVDPGHFINSEVHLKLLQRRNIYYIVGVFLLFETVLTIGIFGRSLDTLGVVAIPEAVIFAIICILLFRKGIRISKGVNLAGICDSLFGQSDMPEISLEEIADQAGLDRREVSCLIPYLFRRGVLQECRQEGDKVILTDPSHAEQAYIHTTCRNCGAELTIKRGFVSLCEYCGSFVDDQGIVQEKEDDLTSVILLSTGTNKGGVISYLHNITGMSVPDVEELLSSLPATVAKTGPAGAFYIRRNLERLGAEVEVK